MTVNMPKVFGILLLTFLLIPWCFAVPPASIIIVPIYIKLLRRLMVLKHR